MDLTFGISEETTDGWRQTGGSDTLSAYLDKLSNPEGTDGWRQTGGSDTLSAYLDKLSNPEGMLQDMGAGKILQDEIRHKHDEITKLEKKHRTLIRKHKKTVQENKKLVGENKKVTQENEQYKQTMSKEMPIIDCQPKPPIPRNAYNYPYAIDAADYYQSLPDELQSKK